MLLEDTKEHELLFMVSNACIYQAEPGNSSKNKNNNRWRRGRLAQVGKALLFSVEWEYLKYQFESAQ